MFVARIKRSATAVCESDAHRKVPNLKIPRKLSRFKVLMGNLSNCLHWIDIYTVFYEESLRLFGRTLGLDIIKRAHRIGVFLGCCVL